MTRTYASSRRLCSVLLFLFFLAPLLAPAADWTEPERQLAAKIAGTTGPGTISLEVINRASFTKTDVETIRRGLTTQLSSQGVQVVKPDQAVAAVQVSLTQNLQDYVWVAEIRQGNSSPTIQMMTVNRSGAAVVAPPRRQPSPFRGRCFGHRNLASSTLPLSKSWAHLRTFWYSTVRGYVSRASITGSGRPNSTPDPACENVASRPTRTTGAP